MKLKRSALYKSWHLLQLNRFIFGLTLLLFSVTLGQIGYIYLEDYTPMEALYMTIITLSTVGFSEVRPLSNTGRIFTIFYILLNLGIFAYAISIFTTYVVEGKFRAFFQQYITSKRIQKMKNHIIVCGYGRNGTRTCNELMNSKREFILIEQEESLVENLLANKQLQYIIGDATTDDALLAAGIERAEALITTLPRDADNVFITLTARQLNPKVHIISRASDESSEKKLYRAGANKVVMPDAIGGIHMAQLITKPEAIEFLNLLTGVSSEHLKLEDFGYDECKDEFKNKTIRELNIRQRSGVTVIGFKSEKAGFTFNPPGDLQFTEGDTMIIIGTAKDMEVFRAYFAH